MPRKKSKILIDGSPSDTQDIILVFVLVGLAVLLVVGIMIVQIHGGK
jgi:hypothetical protein